MVIIYAQNGDVAADSLAREDAARRYPGERVGGRNPQFYEASTAAPVRDAAAIYVNTRWSHIIEDYRGWEIPVHVIEELGAPLQPPAPQPVRIPVPAPPPPAPAPFTFAPPPASILTPPPDAPTTTVSEPTRRTSHRRRRNG